MKKIYYLVEVGGRGYYGGTSIVPEKKVSDAKLYDTKEEAERSADQVNDDCRDNDNADSRACYKPSFYEYEVKEVDFYV